MQISPMHLEEWKKKLDWDKWYFPEGIPKGGVANFHNYQESCQLCKQNNTPGRIKIPASVWEPGQKLSRGGVYGGMYQEMIYLADFEDEGHASPDMHLGDGKAGR